MGWGWNQVNGLRILDVQAELSSNSKNGTEDAPGCDCLCESVSFCHLL